jgi:hypothetical protein
VTEKKQDYVNDVSGKSSPALLYGRRVLLLLFAIASPFAKGDQRGI